MKDRTATTGHSANTNCTFLPWHLLLLIFLLYIHSLSPHWLDSTILQGAEQIPHLSSYDPLCHYVSNQLTSRETILVNPGGPDWIRWKPQRAKLRFPGQRRNSTEELELQPPFLKACLQTADLLVQFPELWAPQWVRHCSLLDHEKIAKKIFIKFIGYTRDILQSICYMAFMELTLGDLGSPHKEKAHLVHQVLKVISGSASEHYLGNS